MKPDGPDPSALSATEIERWVGEARLTCRQVEFSMRELLLALNGMDVERPVFYADSLVERLFRLQRILWPKATDSAARGQTMRELAGVAAGSRFEVAPLAAVVEQPDERFETWLRDLPVEGYHEISVMPGSLLGFASSANYHRRLDADTLVFSVQGTEIDLKKLAEEARRIDLRLKRWNLLAGISK